MHSSQCLNILPYCVLQIVVEFTSKDGALKLRTSASQVVFAGFLKALGRHETEDEDEESDIQGGAEDEQDQGQQEKQNARQDSHAKLVGSLQVGSAAVLCCAVLCCAVLRCPVLRCAGLGWAGP